MIRSYNKSVHRIILPIRKARYIIQIKNRNSEKVGSSLPPLVLLVAWLLKNKRSLASLAKFCDILFKCLAHLFFVVDFCNDKIFYFFDSTESEL